MARGIAFKFVSDVAGLEAGLRRAAGSFDKLKDEAQKTDRAMRSIPNNVEVDLKLGSLAGIRARLEAQRREIQQQVSDIEVDIDPSKALRDLNRIEREIKRIDRLEANVEVNVDKDGGLASMGSKLGKLGETFALLGRGGPYAAAGIAAVGAGLAATFGPGAVGAALTVGAIKIAEPLAKEYAAIQAANRKATTVFGETEGLIRDWAKLLGPRSGLSERQVVGLAASVQDLLVPQGFSRAQAAGITQSIVERGTALAKFSGVDTARGIEAVTAALLGEREQLQGLGVAISQSEVTKWLEDNKGAVQGLTEAQAETVATLALIEQKSGDAWAAFQQGAGGAQGALDTITSSFANLKDKITTTLGNTFADIFGGIEGVDLTAPFQAISDWIDKHDSTIKQFMIQIIDLILIGADNALALGGALLQGFVVAWPAIRVIIGAVGTALNAQVQLSGQLLSLFPATAGLGKSILAMGEGAKTLADGAVAAGDSFVNNFAPDAIAALEAARGKIAETREQLAGMNNTRLQFQVQIEQGGVAQVKQQVNDLTSDKLVDLIATLDPNSKDSSEQTLSQLAMDRITSFFPELEGKSLAEVQGVIRELQREKQIKALITVDASHVEAFLARQRSINVRINYTEGARPGGLSGANVGWRPTRMASFSDASFSPTNIVNVRLDGRQLRYLVDEEITALAPVRQEVA
jgi:hypothetical protein